MSSGASRIPFARARRRQERTRSTAQTRRALPAPPQSARVDRLLHHTLELVAVTPTRSPRYWPLVARWPHRESLVPASEPAASSRLMIRPGAQSSSQRRHRGSLPVGRAHSGRARWQWARPGPARPGLRVVEPERGKLRSALGDGALCHPAGPPGQLRLMVLRRFPGPACRAR
jgi:hypothetical protein